MVKSIINPYVPSGFYKGIVVTTGAAYVYSYYPRELASKTLIHIKETGGAHSAKYIIHGTMDETNYYELQAETVLALSTEAIHVLTDPWRQIRTGYKNDSGAATLRILINSVK